MHARVHTASGCGVAGGRPSEMRCVGHAHLFLNCREVRLPATPCGVEPRLLAGAYKEPVGTRVSFLLPGPASLLLFRLHVHTNPVSHIFFFCPVLLE